jgi:hypothetical protein
VGGTITTAGAGVATLSFVNAEICDREESTGVAAARLCVESLAATVCDAAGARAANRERTVVAPAIPSAAITARMRTPAAPRANI